MGRIRIFALALAALAIPAAALAANSSENTNVVLAKGDNRTGTYYAGGQTITVDGNVAGDVVCAGQTVVINGAVDGDVLCAAQTITVNGEVTGSIRSAGQVVTVNGSVGRNVTVAGQNVVLGSGARVNGEVAVAGNTVVVSGPVQQNVYAGANNLTLNSTVGGNVTSYVEKLSLGSAAVVTGNLDYTSDQTFALDKSKVNGQIVRHAPAQPQRQENTVAERLGSLLYWIVASLLGALLVVWLAPRLVRGVTNTMLGRWQASLGWGALILIGGPLVLIMLAVTVVGLPTAAVAAVLWLLAIITSGVFAGIAVGRLALQNKDTSQRGLALAALIGVPIMVLVGWLPVIGGLVGIITTAWVLGAMALALNRARVLG